jgi:hypothetical protein
MRLKTELYKEEQAEIVSKLISLMNLEVSQTFLLYDLDKDVELQNNILSLVPDIRKFYNCNNIKAVTDPSRIKRAWLSIIKTLLKPVFSIVAEDHHFTKDEKYIHTQKYTFNKIVLAAPPQKSGEV